MTLADLIAQFREEADDKALPYLWSDFLLTQYANEGQREAVRRSRLIVDASTANLAVYAVTASTQKIVLDQRVIFVKAVRLSSKALPLAKVHRKDIDYIFPGWDSTVNLGDVTAYIADKETGVLWFNSPFPASDTVTLDVLREPLYDMRQLSVGTAGTTTTTTTAIDPEIATRYHPSLVHWMLYRSFGKQDTETNDPNKVKNSLDAFEDEFGKKLSAQDEAFRQAQDGYDDYDGVY